MKALCLVGIIMLAFWGCGTQGNTDQNPNDFSVPPQTGKGDTLERGFSDLLSLLEQENTIEPPPIVKYYELPPEAMQLEINTVDVSDYELFRKAAEARLQELYEWYEIEDNMKATSFLESDVEFSMEYGFDHPQIRQYFIDKFIIPDLQIQISDMLPRTTYYFHFTFNDTSAEMIGREYFLIHPSYLQGGEDNAIEIVLDYSEVY